MAMRKASRAKVWPALLLVGGCNAVLGLGDELNERTTTASTGSTTSGDPTSTSSNGTSSPSSSSSSGDGGAGAGGAGPGAGGPGGGGSGGAPLTACGCPLNVVGCDVRVSDRLGFAPTAAGLAITNDHVVVAGPAVPKGATSFGWIDRRSFALTGTNLDGDAGEGWLAGTPGGVVAYARRSDSGAAIERVNLDGGHTPIETGGAPRPFAGLTWAGPAMATTFLAISDSDLVRVDPILNPACKVAKGLGGASPAGAGHGVAAGFGDFAETHAWTTGDPDEPDVAAFQFIYQTGCPDPAPIFGPQVEIAGYSDATTVAAHGSVVTVRAADMVTGDFWVVSVRLESPPTPPALLGGRLTSDSNALAMSSQWTFFPGVGAGLMRCDHALAECLELFEDRFGGAVIHDIAIAEEALYLTFADDIGGERVACVDLSAVPAFP
jgi:hypothetical protein